MNLHLVGLAHERARASLDAVPVERAGVLHEKEHRAEEAEVTDAVGDERLFSSGGVRAVLVPEADEEVAAETDAFPAYEQDRKVVAQYKHQHREHEEVQVREEAPVPLVLLHVRSGIEVDQKSDAGDDQHHDAGEGIDAEFELDGHRRFTRTGRAHPLPSKPRELHVLPGVVRRLSVEDEERHHRGRERDAHRREGHRLDGLLAEALAPEPVHDGAEQGHAQDERQQSEVACWEERGQKLEHRTRCPSWKILKRFGILGERSSELSRGVSSSASRPRRCGPSAVGGRSR